jgi:hypothetical protein
MIADSDVKVSDIEMIRKLPIGYKRTSLSVKVTRRKKIFEIYFLFFDYSTLLMTSKYLNDRMRKNVCKKNNNNRR